MFDFQRTSLITTKNFGKQRQPFIVKELTLSFQAIYSLG